MAEDLHVLGLGNPNDIAKACIYLLSDASRWVTGSNLVVDGGYDFQQILLFRTKILSYE